jgi:hypothetical protein
MQNLIYVNIQTVVFWDVTPFIIVGGYRPGFIPEDESIMFLLNVGVRL